MIKQKEKGKVIVGKTSAEVCVVNIQIRPKVIFSRLFRSKNPQHVASKPPFQ